MKALLRVVRIASPHGSQGSDLLEKTGIPLMAIRLYLAITYRHSIYHEQLVGNPNTGTGMQGNAEKGNNRAIHLLAKGTISSI